MFIVFAPAGYEIYANTNVVEKRKQYFRDLRIRFRPDRLGILKNEG
jgi:hypothetical protein